MSCFTTCVSSTRSLIILGRLFKGVVDALKLVAVSPNAPTRLALSIMLELCKPSRVACTDAKGDCMVAATLGGSAVDRIDTKFESDHD